MAKGIRVSALAKELGVENKVILGQLAREELAVANHQSTISLGLAESVREWFQSGKMNDLIEQVAAESHGSHAKKKATTKKKKSDEAGGDEHAGDTATAVADPEAADTEAKAPRPHVRKATRHDDAVSAGETHAVETSVEADTDAPTDADAENPVAPAAPAAPAVVEPAVGTPEPSVATPAALAPVATPPAPVAPAAPLAPAAPGVSAPAASAPGAAAPSAAAPGAPAAGASAVPATPSHPTARAIRPEPSARPTVKLESKGATPMRPDRPRAPLQPFVPAPAQLQGPRLIREERPDVVSAPRKKLPPGSGTQPPVFMQPTARGGRGVKSAEEDEDGEKKATAKGKGAGPLSARRRGPDGRRGEADEKLKEFSEQDLRDRSDRLNAAAASRQATDLHLRKTEARGTHIQAKTLAERGGVVEIEEPITVRSLSTTLGVKSNEILTRLIKQGVFANVNQTLDFDTAGMLALAYNVELKIKAAPTLEEELMHEFDAREVEEKNLKPRPAVVTILGHVDHGKTSLLDKIRKANVAAGEAGGITQHIAAWTVQLGEKKVTFIDTPGHQAFTAMRARGANMTDVVVLVVSAAEGVQPQTIESINHAKAAGVPIIVAMNKIDRQDANPDMVLGQLAGAGLNPTEWGGDTEVIRVSATTGQGVSDLIEMLDYQTELRQLKADPTSPARGSVIEARIDPGLGSIATVLVQNGTLRVGDVVLAGQGYGRVRSLLDDHLRQIKEAGPSTPVIIAGLSELPSAGDKFYSTDDMDRAKSISEERLAMQRQQQQANLQRVSLESIFGQMKDQTVKTINLIIKADVQGSIETLQKTVTDQNTEEVRVKVIHAAVGSINESDVELADASGAVIIGFHVVPDDAARAMAEARRIEIRTYRVIYEIFDDLKKALSGMLAPEIREKHHGTVEIRQVFKVSRLGNIAGCFVTEGHVQRGSKLRLSRDGKVITEDLTIETLKRVKDDVKEVKQGFECGLKIAGYDDIKVGDRLEAYIRETITRTL